MSGIKGNMRAGDKRYKVEDDSEVWVKKSVSVRGSEEDKERDPKGRVMCLCARFPCFCLQEELPDSKIAVRQSLLCEADAWDHAMNKVQLAHQLLLCRVGHSGLSCAVFCGKKETSRFTGVPWRHQRVLKEKHCPNIFFFCQNDSKLSGILVLLFHKTKTKTGVSKVPGTRWKFTTSEWSIPWLLFHDEQKFHLVLCSK